MDETHPKYLKSGFVGGVFVGMPLQHQVESGDSSSGFGNGGGGPHFK